MWKQVGLVRIDPEVKVPCKSHSFDAGLDLHANADFELIPQDAPILIPTGLKLGIPKGYAGLILPRSGLAAKFGVTVANSPGLIDSGYRGEVMVSLVNHHPVRSHKIEKGDRIAQLLIIPIAEVTFLEFESDLYLNKIFETDERQEAGFGSSGK